ncbi:hypothetical protein F5Y16DRAFT_406037 [Xylariaceae sp. FL0255]|nr:hypothetical protein F5Y16DRAFT_406037 [Xylariaceae sp. FL0255]
MATTNQTSDSKNNAPKKPGFVSGLFSHTGSAAKKAWDGGGITRAPKDLLLEYNPYYSSGIDYSPLPTPTSVRLLRVEAGRTGDAIRCTLTVVDLKDNPKFIALSYSWEKDVSWTRMLLSIAVVLAGDTITKFAMDISRLRKRKGAE